MRIFGTKSPVDFIHGEKPERPEYAPEPNRLKKLALQVGPLLGVKSMLDKVYSHGYFETHYPDADRTMKRLLHDKAMGAWAHAEHFGRDTQFEGPEKGERETKQVNLIINLSI